MENNKSHGIRTRSTAEVISLTPTVPPCPSSATTHSTDPVAYALQRHLPLLLPNLSFQPMTLRTRRSVFTPRPRSRAKIDLARNHALAINFRSR